MVNLQVLREHGVSMCTKGMRRVGWASGCTCSTGKTQPVTPRREILCVQVNWRPDFKSVIVRSTGQDFQYLRSPSFHSYSCSEGKHKEQFTPSAVNQAQKQWSITLANSWSKQEKLSAVQLCPAEREGRRGRFLAVTNNLHDPVGPRGIFVTRRIDLSHCYILLLTCSWHRTYSAYLLGCWWMKRYGCSSTTQHLIVNKCLTDWDGFAHGHAECKWLTCFFSIAWCKRCCPLLGGQRDEYHHCISKVNPWSPNMKIFIVEQTQDISCVSNF